jgi:hypothetical protein
LQVQNELWRTEILQRFPTKNLVENTKVGPKRRLDQRDGLHKYGFSMGIGSNPCGVGMPFVSIRRGYDNVAPCSCNGAIFTILPMLE